MKLPRLGYLLSLALLAIAYGCAPTAVTELPPPSVLVDVAVDLVGPRMEVGENWLYADGTVLVAVPAGSFIMGHGGVDDPIREVTLPDYWIYSTEVTNSQYAYCVRMEGCTPPYSPDNPGFDDYLHANDPVTGVDHGQAQAYCSFAHTRLPTEAEWEKAARGPEAYTYPWGNDDPTCDRLNYLPCKGNPTPVNTHPDGRSYYGAFDMAGNVFEWAADWYQAEYYVSAPAENPQGAEKGSRRSVRSSGFNSGANQTQVYNRFNSDPVDHRANLGFRCVVDDPDYFASFCEYPAIYGTEGIGGASSGESMQVTCPELGIEQNPTCKGTIPITFVTLDNHPLPSEHVDVTVPAACTLEDKYDTEYTCTGGGQYKICSTCKISLTVPAQCPAGYSYDNNSKNCLGKGTPGMCLPGTSAVTTSEGTCCAFTAGIAGPTADPLKQGGTFAVVPPYKGCPPGTWVVYEPGNTYCIPVPVQDPYCVEEGVVLNSCTGGGFDSPPQGCPPQSCGQNYAWDPDSCSCVCDGC